MALKDVPSNNKGSIMLLTVKLNPFKLFMEVQKTTNKETATQIFTN